MKYQQKLLIYRTYIIFGIILWTLPRAAWAVQIVEEKCRIHIFNPKSKILSHLIIFQQMPPNVAQAQLLIQSVGSRPVDPGPTQSLFEASLASYGMNWFIRQGGPAVTYSFPVIPEVEIPLSLPKLVEKWILYFDPINLPEYSDDFYRKLADAYSNLQKNQLQSFTENANSEGRPAKIQRLNPPADATDSSANSGVFAQAFHLFSSRTGIDSGFDPLPEAEVFSVADLNDFNFTKEELLKLQKQVQAHSPEFGLIQGFLDHLSGVRQRNNAWLQRAIRELEESKAIGDMNQICSRDEYVSSRWCRVIHQIDKLKKTDPNSFAILAYEERQANVHRQVGGMLGTAKEAFRNVVKANDQNKTALGDSFAQQIQAILREIHSKKEIPGRLSAEILLEIGEFELLVEEFADLFPKTDTSHPWSSVKTFTEATQIINHSDFKFHMDNNTELKLMKAHLHIVVDNVSKVSLESIDFLLSTKLLIPYLNEIVIVNDWKVEKFLEKIMFAMVEFDFSTVHDEKLISLFNRIIIKVRNQFRSDELLMRRLIKVNIDEKMRDSGILSLRHQRVLKLLTSSRGR